MTVIAQCNTASQTIAPQWYVSHEQISNERSKWFQLGPWKLASVLSGNDPRLADQPPQRHRYKLIATVANRIHIHDLPKQGRSREREREKKHKSECLDTIVCRIIS